MIGQGRGAGGPRAREASGGQFRGRGAAPGLVSGGRTAPSPGARLALLSPGLGVPGLGLLGAAPAVDWGGAADPSARTQSSVCWRPSKPTWTSSVPSAPGDPVSAGGWTG